MSLVPGDPAGLSACAATAAASARRLTDQAQALRPAVEELREGWTGRGSAALRRRGGEVATAAATAAAELERVARVLQDQATDLAGLHARARAVAERAAGCGLTVRDERVVPAYGVLREADPAADRARAATAVSLQAELDLVLALHRRRRDFVLGVLRESTGRLAATSHDLRRG